MDETLNSFDASTFQEFIDFGQAQARSFLTGEEVNMPNVPDFLPQVAQDTISEFQQFFSDFSDSVGTDENSPNLPEPVAEGIDTSISAQQQFINFGQQAIANLSENDPITGSGGGSGDSTIPGVEFDFVANEGSGNIGRVVGQFGDEEVTLFNLGSSGGPIPSFLSTEQQGGIGSFISSFLSTEQASGNTSL